MASTAEPLAEPLSHRLSSVSSLTVDIDPGWYEGQPETSEDTQQQALQHQEAQQPGAAPGVPTVLTKLQKWGDYESVGEPVGATKFVPCKTPLSRAILSDWQLPEAPRHRLTVTELLAVQRAAGRRVGLLLDLSNHDCLYSDDIPCEGDERVSYVHIQLVAKELPPLGFVRQVAAAANAFWARQPDQYIAIHCAYGFNRTGFVVASYLIEHHQLSVDDALAAFATARPPGVKHEKFKAELVERYGGLARMPAQLTPLPQQQPQHQQQQQQRAGLECRAACAERGCSHDAAAWPSGPDHALGCSTSPGRGRAPAGCKPSGGTSSSSSSTGAGVLRQAHAAEHAGPCQQQVTQPPRVLPPPPPPPSTAGSAGASGGGLPPLTPSSSGRAPLSAVSLSRLSMGRCWSSGSVGDNSSIGCSPDSSTGPDLLSLRCGSAASSGLGSSRGRQQHGDASPGAPGASGWRAQAPCQRRSGGGDEQEAAAGEDDEDGAQEQLDDAAASQAAEDEADEGCFEMDAADEPPSDGGSGASHGASAQQPCCSDAAACCSSVQQLPDAQLSGLLAAATIEQQEQLRLGRLPRHASSQERQAAEEQQQQQQQQLARRSTCSCTCHALASGRPQPATAADACSEQPPQPPLQAQHSRRLSAADGLVRGRPGGAAEVLDNESFGEALAADLMASLRGLRQHGATFPN